VQVCRREKINRSIKPELIPRDDLRSDTFETMRRKDIAQNASIRGMRVDGVDLFSLLDIITYVCPGRNSCCSTVSTTQWKRLILNDSQSCQNDMTQDQRCPNGKTKSDQLELIFHAMIQTEHCVDLRPPTRLV